MSLPSGGGKANNVSVEGKDGNSVDVKANNLVFGAGSTRKFVEGDRVRKVFSGGGNANNSVVNYNAGKLLFEILDSPNAAKYVNADTSLV